jgi:ATP-dependent DNA helicase RecG
MPVQYVKGVGPSLAEALQRLGVATAEDLILHFPRDYQDRTHLTPISQLTDGETATVIARVASADSRKARTGITVTRVVVEDDTGLVSLVFFNQRYLQDQFTRLRGRQILIHGQPVRDRWDMQFRSPDWEPLSEVDSPRRVLPIYPLCEGLTQGRLRRAIAAALDRCLHLMPEPIPHYLRERRSLPDVWSALRGVHQPDSIEEMERARRRLVYEELLVLQVALAARRNALNREPGVQFPDAPTVAARFAQQLPFELTAAQQRVVQQITADMASPRPMNRLLQGDVGSGKTVVAACAIAAAVEAGYQAAVMAPTEILAEQHHRVFRNLLEPFGVRVSLLIGSLSAAERQAACQAVATGQSHVAIGTHALIQEGVAFGNLGLVVIDEQHRFGVVQRASLRAKGVNPDVLVMTATPIPRTLALTVYGDLDVSIIDEMPPGRRPVRTHWKRAGDRQKVYEGIRRLVSEGRQAYIVCPLVEESEKLAAQAATDLAERLQREVFPDLKVGLLHGQMRPAEKDAAMDDFRAGRTHVLVTTTVIEVGVDVPNASVMVVEDAERFGLAQLHQLRGRVGRGEHQSYCVLLGDARTPEGEARLQVMASTTDGFRIAEEDLRLRGPGEFYGTRQSGLPSLRIANVVRDLGVLEQAREDAQQLVEGDPDLAEPEHRILAGQVRRRCPSIELASVS